LRGRLDGDPDWRLAYWSVLMGSLVLAFLYGFLSTMAFKGMFAMVPLFVSGVVVVYRCALAADGERRSTVLAWLFTGAVCLAVGSGSCSVRAYRSYGDSPIDRLTAEFSHPRFAGIRSTPARVAVLEGIASYLSERVEEGDFLLAYDDVPLLYYLTGTRPAIDHSWSTRRILRVMRERSLRRMIAARRIPRYAVQNLERSTARNPIHAFVSERYTREIRFGRFQVWKLRDEPPAPGRR
ncbi:MAG: hypothetical protein V3U03_16535, partial [Myxococcota bacterium]